MRLSLDCFVALSKSKASRNDTLWLLAMASFSLLFLLITDTAHARFGPTQTKRERLKMEMRAVPIKSATPHQAYLPDYDRIRESFLKEDYASVDKLSTQYLPEGPNRQNREDILYLQAMSLLKLGRGEEAREKLTALEYYSMSMDRKAGASVSIADSYFYEGKFSLAAQSYEQTLKKYPGSDQTAYIQGRLAGLRSNGVGKLMGERFFTVQVGSFSKEKNAKALVNKLIRRNYDAYIEKDEKDRMVRVRVGKFSSKEDALTLEIRLKREGYPTKIYP